jgi:hypothetical protein
MLAILGPIKAMGDEFVTNDVRREMASAILLATARRRLDACSALDDGYGTRGTSSPARVGQQAINLTG